MPSTAAHESTSARLASGVVMHRVDAFVACLLGDAADRPLIAACDLPMPGHDIRALLYPEMGGVGLRGAAYCLTCDDPRGGGISLWPYGRVAEWLAEHLAHAGVPEVVVERFRTAAALCALTTPTA